MSVVHHIRETHQDLFRRFICKYNPIVGIRRMMESGDIRYYDECIDIIHDIILKSNIIDDDDYEILNGLSECEGPYTIKDMVSVFRRLKDVPPKIDTVDDMYILLAYLREFNFRDKIIQRHFIDKHLPYRYMSTPYNRDEIIKARYTSSINEDVIQINIPSQTGGITERLNQNHIDLAKQQKHKTI